VTKYQQYVCSSIKSGMRSNKRKRYFDVVGNYCEGTLCYAVVNGWQQQNVDPLKTGENARSGHKLIGSGGNLVFEAALTLLQRR
jgi:hypothetical protein